MREERLFGPEELVLCACSGGPDSNALLHCLALLMPRVGHRLHAVGVDHGLRPEAQNELALAARLAAAHGVGFDVVSARVQPGGNLQARARAERHRALSATAERVGAAVIALAHTADDRAETVLMRLLRGAGPRGLAVMSVRASSPVGGGVDLVRPIVAARRADVLKHLERHELPWAEDASNRDRRFLRARVRHEVMPLLEQLSPGIVAHLCALAEMMTDIATAAASAGGHERMTGLGRAQRRAIERALRLGRPGTTVRLSGGRDLPAGLFGGNNVGDTPVLGGKQ